MTTTTVVRESRKGKPFYQDMSVQVFAGMALGALIGWLWPQSAEWMRTIGDLFIRLIAMFVGLIIFCAVVGAAGVTGAAFIVLAATLASVGTIPVASIALILGIHRFMSEALVPTNLIGNAVATIVVCKWENALDEAKMRSVLYEESDAQAEEPEQVLA
jgi:Na+/H+-dicarboxylate symporter